MLKIGTQNLSGMYVGEQKIKKAFVGTKLVFDGAQTYTVYVTASDISLDSLLKAGTLAVADETIKGETTTVITKKVSIEVSFILSRNVNVPRSVSVNGIDIGHVGAAGDSVSTTVSVSDGMTIAIEFTKYVPSYTITTDVDPSGAGTASGGGTFEDGQSVTLTASAADGYEFAAWRENGSNVSTSATYTFTASANRTITAVFAAIPSYTVTASIDPSGAGAVTGAGTYRHGTSVTVTATPADGYTFSGWKNGSTTVSTAASYTFTLTGNVTLTAAFATASRLPAGYTEVEYVKSTATIYIATGITPNISTTKIESKWMLDSLTNNYNPFFGGGVSNGYYYARANSATSFAYRFRSETGGEQTKTVTSMVGRQITIDVNYSSRTLILDGSSVSMGTVNAPSSELYLFNMAKKSLSSYKFSGKCYYFKIYSGSSLVADFVPCKNPSGVAGMYDTVRKAFYTTPINTSGLTAGPAV